MLHRLSVRIDIESETKEEALSALGNILDQYEMAVAFAAIGGR